MTLVIRPARPGDAPLINKLVRELAVYEKLEHEVVATDELMDAMLFGPNPRIFGDIAEWNGEAVGFTLCSTTSRVSRHATASILKICMYVKACAEKA